MHKKILILYSEVMPYTVALVNQLITDYKCEILLIHWDHRKLTPYQFQLENVKVYGKSQLTYSDLHSLINEYNPTLIFASGVMDKDYLKECKFYKKKGVPTVMCCDTQWNSNLKNYIKSLFSYSLYRKYYNYCWVPGVLQYQFATKIGFKSSNIIQNLYSANTDKFLNTSINLEYKERRILFVGRLHKRKNIINLINVFLEINKSLKEKWKLRIVGNGPLKPHIKENKNIEIYEFSNQDELIEHANSSIVFCLPSLFEAWGVVIHEFSALGLALLLSDKCGASKTFLINGYNGYEFSIEKRGAFLEAMKKIMNLPTDELVKMGARSKHMSERITLEESAASIMSLLK